MDSSEDKEYQEYLQRKRDIEDYYEGQRVEVETQQLLADRDARNALIESIREFNPEALFADGLEDAIIGYDTKGRVIYSVGKILDIFVKRDGMEYDEASEFFSFNVDGAYVGDYTPIYMYEE